jgi:hypothetical protein
VQCSIQESIAFHLPYEEIKKGAFEGFGKPLDYRVFKKLDTKIEGNDVKK